jgi:hypothetical protein
MAASIEVSYFNSFWLKQVRDTNSDAVWPDGYPYQSSFPGTAVNGDNNWFIEESRIRGGYNNTQVDLGVKAYIVEEESKQQHRSNALIYSGIFNSRTGINNTNQFSVGESITKATDPANGSIQKLYAEDTNLIVFQENKVSRALIDKDAIYSAEGNASVTSTSLVVGQIVPYAGNFGISRNPESFAVYGYQKYFADKDRNAILRLSMDGITEISNYGMSDFFRDNLSDIGEYGKIVGGYDIHNKNYTISLQKTAALQNNQDDPSNYATLSFDELVGGWSSFYTYKPTGMISLKNKFFSFKNGVIYKHYADTNGNNRGYFYGEYSPSNITFVFNENSSTSKNFQTVNYEGDNGWQVTSFSSDQQKYDNVNGGWFSYDDTTAQVPSYSQTYNDGGVIYRLGFDRKENKYFANLINNSPARDGEVVWGNEMSGIKGYFATVTFSTDAITDVGGAKELWSVGSKFVVSSY